MSKDDKNIPVSRLIRSEKIFRNKEVMENIVASMSDGVMLINHKGEIVLVNQALSEILEIPTTRMMGKSWAELFFDEPANEVFNEIIIDIIQRRICHYNRQVSYKTTSGRIKELIATTTLMTTDSHADEVSGVLLILNDISQVVSLHHEQQQLLLRSKRLYKEKMEGLDRLARAVAHEIRNPVTTIGGLVQRLYQGKEPAGKDAQYLRRILDCTRQLETVVREVRAYADLPVPNLREVDLGLWLGELAADFMKKAALSKIDMIHEKSVGRSGEISAEVDEEQLKRILLMILENAADAMPEGGKIRLGLSLDAGVVTIAISDTGRGIDPADMPYLFDPFFTTKAESVGMSLAIAKRVALDHEGDLAAQHRPGGGTTFTLTIPQKPLHEEDKKQERPRPPSLK